MIHIERSLVIDASPDAVWEVLGRFMHIDEFAPFVVSVDALTPGADGLGSIRRCNFDNGGSLVEEVIDWRPGQSYRIRASEFGPIPMTTATVDIKLQPMGPARTQVIWAMDCQMKYGPVGWLMGQTLVKRSVGKVLEANLAALGAKVCGTRSAA